ncbi:MAG: hypothetical protein JWP09_491 [Candidatus Taylorbacteria bacterium]|nr:hypothetical protein [Candidatus Taylorbacteria bacterium]
MHAHITIVALTGGAKKLKYSAPITHIGEMADYKAINGARVTFLPDRGYPKGGWILNVECNASDGVTHGFEPLKGKQGKFLSRLQTLKFDK